MRRLAVPVLLLLITMILQSGVSAHRPILHVTDNRDGSLLFEGDFDNGESAEGVEIYLVEDRLFEGDLSVRDFCIPLMRRFLELFHGEVLDERPFDPRTYGSEDDPFLFEGRLVLFTAQLDQASRLTLIKPGIPYQLVFDD